MTYQFPEKEYNEEKYIKYLTELGFRALTQQDTDKLQGYYNGYEWYIYDGDLELDELLIGTISLVITGDLIVHQPFVDIDETCGCLIVQGKTKVNFMAVKQHCFFYGGIEFQILYLAGGAEGVVNNPQGRLLYIGHTCTDVNDVSPENVEVFFNEQVEKYFGDMTKLLPKKYLYFDNAINAGTLNFYEYKKLCQQYGYEINYKNYMENPQNYNFKTFSTFDEYLEENEGSNWSAFVADTGLLIDFDPLWQDVMQGKKVFNSKEKIFNTNKKVRQTHTTENKLKDTPPKGVIKPQSAPENIEWNPILNIWMALIDTTDNGEETWHYWDKRGYLFVKMRYDRENHPIEITYFPPDDAPENSLYLNSYDRWIPYERLEAIREAKGIDKEALYNPVTEQWILPGQKEKKQKQQKAEADRLKNPVYDVSHYEQVIPKGAHIPYQEAYEKYKLASTSVDYGYQAYVIKDDVYIKNEDDLKKLKAEIYRDGNAILVVDGDLVVAGRVDDSFPLFVVQGDLKCESLILTDESISATIWGNTYVKHAIYYRDNALEMDFYGTTYTPYFFTDNDDRPLDVTLPKATIKINYDSNTRRYRRDVKYDYVKKDLPMVLAYEVFDFGYKFDIERFIDFVAKGNDPIRETPLSKKELRPLMQQKLNDSIADIISDKDRTTLDLSHLNLKDIPEGVFELTQLEELRLSGNKIKKISKEISKLKHLRVLDLSANDRVNIKAVCALTQLQVLDFKMVHGSAVLPNELKKLKNLKKLDIWSGYFENIEVVSELENLETLSINATNIPKNGKKLTKLETLGVLNGDNEVIDFALQLPALKHFTTNCLQALPDRFYQLTQLETLGLYSPSLNYSRDNKGINLKKLSLFKNLNSLDLSYLEEEKLVDYCEAFFNLKIEHLNLQSVNLSERPELVSNLHKFNQLKSIDFSGNSCAFFAELNDDFFNLDLEKLGFRECFWKAANEQVDHFLKNIVRFKHLTHLNVIGCNLTTLPFEQLTQLEHLEIAYNHSLQDLSGIGKLKNLKYLDLDIPALKTLPEDFFTLENLQYLNIPQNSFTKELLDRIKKTFKQTEIKLEF